MMGILNRICVFSLAALVTASAFGQTATYDPSTGIMNVDSGMTDLVAVFITGPDVSVSGCTLCDGNNLPGEDALAGASTWTVGRSAGSTQWIRTNPLAGRGFVGSIGDYYVDGNGATVTDWPADVPPFLNFPEAGMGIAVYAAGLGDADFGEVTFASDDGSTSVGVVDIVPEPATFSLLGLAGLALLGLRRR